jgi:hypothetical protein
VPHLGELARIAAIEGRQGIGEGGVHLKAPAAGVVECMDSTVNATNQRSKAR